MKLLEYFAGFACALALSHTAAAQVLFTIPSPAEALGNVRDLDGDGRRELVLGAPSLSLLEIRTGANGALLSSTTAGLAPSARFASSIDVLGDLDLDGFDELVVGAPNDGIVGSVRVVSSRTGAVLRNFSALGQSSTACPLHPKLYGFAVKAIGDLTGDGFSEVAIGAPGWDNANCADFGLVEIVDVRPATPVFVNTLKGRGLSTNGPFSCASIHDVQFGYSLASVGDLNQDGILEIVVGAPGANEAIGFDGVSCLATFTPVVTSRLRVAGGQSLGVSISGIGDIDGDGTSDVVTGVPNLSLMAANLATTYRFSGKSVGNYAGGFPPPLGLIGFGAALGRQLGWSMARIRDMNGDGISDFLAGAGSPCNTIPGAHYILSGANGGILQFVTHPTSPTYGQAVCPTGNAGPNNRPTFMVADPSSGTVTVR
ncbi:MAG TPA: integrin alpha [Planctomycetota bacterium]|nr:integrin alpha [Planctomycetota bacterium]